MGGCKVDKSKFSLHHTDMGLFHSSQWSPPGITTLGYTLYRLVLASLMTAGIIAHIIDFTGNNPGYKWLIYMTNQVIECCSIKDSRRLSSNIKGRNLSKFWIFYISGNIAADNPLCSLRRPCHS